MSKCPKCEENADGLTFVEGGYTFTFCKTCSDILDELDRTGNVIHDFLGSKKKESGVARNIREARERRARGELYWD